MQIIRRTFLAAKEPKGSDTRALLNLDWRTSEYMTSHRYGLVTDSGEQLPFTFRTKAEGLDKIARLGWHVGTIVS